MIKNKLFKAIIDRLLVMMKSICDAATALLCVYMLYVFMVTDYSESAWRLL